MQLQIKDPIHLTASATIQSNSRGSPNTVSLKNPNGGPMELLAIKWQIEPTTQNQVFTGGAVGCKLDLGSLPLTNGFVPVWSFGPGRYLQLGMTLTTYKPILQFGWKLPVPLYVPSGAVVAPSFEHRGQLSDDITVRISYECRSIDPRVPPPPKVPVPYAACYVSKALDCLQNAVVTDTSAETDLINPFNEKLNINRFIGRLAVFNSSGTPFNIDLESFVGSLVLQGRMMDSNGNRIVPNFTAFRQIFSSVTRSWDVGHKLDPKAYYSFYLNKILPPSPYIAQSDVIFAQAFVSMVGWREIDRKGI